MAKQSTKPVRIGITGHRKLSTEKTVALESLIKRAIENIIKYHHYELGQSENVVFTSPIAKGADTLFANVANKYFHGKLRIILPFEKDEYIKDFETVEDKNEFERLLINDKVSEIIVLNKTSSNERNELYIEVGKKVVDENDYLIAIWNEEIANGKGGTGDIVDYAISKKKNILVINPSEENLVIKWSYLPEFKTEKILPFKTVTNNLEFHINLFKTYDKLAIENQTVYKNIWAKCFNLGLIIAFVFSLKLSLHVVEEINFLLTLLEISFVIWIIKLIATEKKNFNHKKYLTNRFIAERLRINKIIFECGFHAIIFNKFQYNKSVSQLEKLAPVAISNKIITLCSYSKYSTIQKINAIKELIDNQYDYHKNRIKKLEAMQKKNSLIFQILFITSFLLISTEAIFEVIELNHSYHIINIFELELPHFIHPLSIFLSVSIPAIMARLETIKYLNEWEAMISQSEFMISIFEDVNQQLDISDSDENLSSIIAILNENMNNENKAWENTMRNKNEIPKG